MSEYAADALRGWIRAGMPGTRIPMSPVCSFCSRPVLTVCRNWTVCKDGVKHTKKTATEAKS